MSATSSGPAPTQRLHPGAFAFALAAHAAALAALVALVQTAPRHKEAVLILEAPPPGLAAAAVSPRPASQSAPKSSAAPAPAPSAAPLPPPEAAPRVVPEAAPRVVPEAAPRIAPEAASHVVPEAAPRIVPEETAPPPPVERKPLRPATLARAPAAHAVRPSVEPRALPPPSQSASAAPTASAEGPGPAAQPRSAPAAPSATVGADWRNELGAWLQAHKHYPDAAREHGDEGRATIRFTVSRDGRVLSYSLVSSSGSASLDEAAQAMFRGATLPPLPASMDQSEITVTVPIRFTLER